MAQRGEIELIKKRGYWFVRHPDDQSRIEFDRWIERYRQLETAFVGESVYEQQGAASAPSIPAGLGGERQSQDKCNPHYRIVD